MRESCLPQRLLAWCVSAAAGKLKVEKPLLVVRETAEQAATGEKSHVAVLDEYVRGEGEEEEEEEGGEGDDGGEMWRKQLPWMESTANQIDSLRCAATI